MISRVGVFGEGEILMRGVLLSNSFYFGSGQSRFRVELCIILPETKYFAKIQFLLTNNCDPCAGTTRRGL